MKSFCYDFFPFFSKSTSFQVFLIPFSNPDLISLSKYPRDFLSLPSSPKTKQKQQQTFHKSLRVGAKIELSF